jgi:hypothetical protein
VVRLQEAEVGLHWTDDLEDALASVFREVRGGCPPSYARSPLSRENAAV